MEVGKTFLSFLGEAPEDIIAVKSRDGKERKVKKDETSGPAAPLKRALALSRPSAGPKPIETDPRFAARKNRSSEDGTAAFPSRTPADLVPAVLRGRKQDSESDGPEARARRLKRQFERNPELLTQIKGNEFLKNKVFDDEEFANNFFANERFREHFFNLDKLKSSSGTMLGIKNRDPDPSRPEGHYLRKGQMQTEFDPGNHYEKFELDDEDKFSEYYKAIARLVGDHDPFFDAIGRTKEGPDYKQRGSGVAHNPTRKKYDTGDRFDYRRSAGGPNLPYSSGNKQGFRWGFQRDPEKFSKPEPSSRSASNFDSINEWLGENGMTPEQINQLPDFVDFSNLSHRGLFKSLRNDEGGLDYEMLMNSLGEENRPIMQSLIDGVSLDEDDEERASHIGNIPKMMRGLGTSGPGSNLIDSVLEYIKDDEEDDFRTEILNDDDLDFQLDDLEDLWRGRNPQTGSWDQAFSDENKKKRKLISDHYPNLMKTLFDMSDDLTPGQKNEKMIGAMMLKDAASTDRFQDTLAEGENEDIINSYKNMLPFGRKLYQKDEDYEWEVEDLDDLLDHVDREVEDLKEDDNWSDDDYDDGETQTFFGYEEYARILGERDEEGQPQDIMKLIKRMRSDMEEEQERWQSSADDIRREREEEEERRREEEEEAEEGESYDGERGTHPRLLWGADTPEEAPRRSAQSPIERARDAALGRMERGAAGAAEKAREAIPADRRDKIEADPRAQAAYERLRRLNLRGSSDYEEDENGIPVSTYDKSYGSDFTSFDLNFHDNPNQFETHLIPSLDGDLERAGLERGDLRRAVYIAWGAHGNRSEAARRFKQRFGDDANTSGPEFDKFMKRIAALNAKENWKQNVLPDLEKGDILYNTPIGGEHGERALLYQMMGFGKDGPQGQQAVVGPDGKVFPLDPPSERSMARHKQARQAAVRARRGAQTPTPTPTPPTASAPETSSASAQSTAPAELSPREVERRQLGNMLNLSIADDLEVPEPTTETQRRIVNTMLQQVPGYIRDSIAAGMPEDSPQMNQQAVERLVQTLVMNNYADGSMDTGRLSLIMRSVILPLLTRSLRESYITEEMQDEVGFFKQMFPGLEEEELMEILELLSQMPEEQEREPDSMDTARNQAFARLNPRIHDHDD